MTVLESVEEPDTMESPNAKRRKRRKRRDTSPTAHIFSKQGGAHPIRGFLQFAAIPTFAFLVVVTIPFVVGILLSFTNWSGIDSVTSFDYDFTGTDNYSEALGDEEFRSTLSRTAVYVIGVVVFSNLAALGLALLVTSKLRGQNVFRALFFTPNLIGGVILGFIWVFIFRNMFTYMGDTLGIGFLQSNWLVDPEQGIVALIMVTVWQLSGYLMLIYIAGLVSIPTELLEAARVDGASAFQQLFYVKIRLIVPSIAVSVFLALRNSFLAFDVNLALTDGGPFRSTELVTLNVYNEAFKFGNFATAQSKAVILFLIIAVLAALQVLASRRFEVEQ